MMMDRIKKLFGKKDQTANATPHMGKDMSFVASEAFKLLRTNISFSFPDTNGCYVVGVTSSMRGEGKTIISMNLAYSMAQKMVEQNKKVLLIEGDMRLPTFCKKAELRTTPGLSNLFTDAKFSDAVQSWDGILDVLTCGDIPPNPAELLASKKMESLLDELKKSYDVIIVDLPPIYDVSDALAISPYLDGMVLVVRKNYVPKSLVNQTLARFEVAKVRVIGTILNAAGDAQATKEGKYYRKSYKKSYGHYYSSHEKAKKAKQSESAALTDENGD